MHSGGRHRRESEKNIVVWMNEWMDELPSLVSRSWSCVGSVQSTGFLSAMACGAQSELQYPTGSTQTDKCEVVICEWWLPAWTTDTETGQGIFLQSSKPEVLHWSSTEKPQRQEV